MPEIITKTSSQYASASDLVQLTSDNVKIGETLLQLPSGSTTYWFQNSIIKTDNGQLLSLSKAPLDGSSTGVYVQSFDPSISTNNTLIQVNQSIVGSQTPFQIIQHEGKYLALWVSKPSDSNYRVIARHLDGDGNPIGSEVELAIAGSTYNAGNPIVTALQSGELILGHKYSGEVRFEKFDSSLNKIDGVRFTDANSYDPAVVQTAGGKLFVATDEHGSDGDQYGVTLYELDPTNLDVVSQRTLNHSISKSQQDVDLVNLEGGGFVALWHYTASSYTSHFIRFFNDDGSPTSFDIQVAPSETYGKSAKVLPLSDGRVIVFYQSEEFSDSGLEYSIVSPDGTVQEFGIEFNSVRGGLIDWAPIQIDDSTIGLLYSRVTGYNAEDVGSFIQYFELNSVPSGELSLSGNFLDGEDISIIDTLQDSDGISGVTYEVLVDENIKYQGVNKFFTLSQADVGANITVVAQYTDGIGTLETVTLTSDVEVQNRNDPLQGSVAIVGTPNQGSVLSVNSSELSDIDGLGTFAFQWFSDGVAIDGETDTSIILTQSEVDKAVSVSIGYTDDYGTFESVTSVDTSKIINVNDDPIGSVIINGTTKEDEVLSIDVSGLSDPDGLGAFSYQWIRDGSAVEGARNETYTLKQADVGSELSARVNYSDGFGFAESVISAGTSTIVNLNDDVSGIISVVGTLEENRTLSVDSNSLTDEDGLGEFFYQWKSDDEPIFGATSSSFKLTQSEVGKSISVSVSFTDDYGGVEQVTSAETSAVQNLNNTPEGVVSIDGITTLGATLTANTTLLSDLDGLGALSYQWLRSGVTVDGATDESFTLSDLDIGEILSVRVNYTDGFGETETVMSSQSSFVDGGFLDLNVVTFDRFGGELSSIVSADSLMNGDQFFVQEQNVVGDTSSDHVGFSVSTYAIIVRPEVDIAAVDFNLTVTSGLVDFTPSSSLLNWTIQTNTNDLDKVVFSGIATTDGDNDLPRGQDTAIAFFDVISVADFTVNEISLNGIAKQDVFTIDDLTAVSKNGSDTLYEVLHGADTFVFADKAIDTASDKAIGAFDALQALRLAVGLDKSDGTSEWHDYIAADINKDGRVGADDALSILKFAVGLTDGPSAEWVFVDGDADHSGIDRSNTDYNEGILISDVMTDMSINMTGILVGDVDGSYIA